MAARNGVLSAASRTPERRRLENTREETTMKSDIREGVSAGRRRGRRARRPRRPSAQDISACLITKTDTNPFFVKMREGATAKAEELGIDAVEPTPARSTATTNRQVAAIETCVANGAKGILITASDTAAITPVLQTARDAGVLVIALDTPLEPGRRRRRHLRHRQLPGRPADRPVGQGDARRRGGGRQDRHARPRDQPAVGRRAARPGLPDGLRHRPRRTRTSGATRTIRASPATT